MKMAMDERIDPVERLIRDCTAEEFVDWLIEYKGLPADVRENTVSNLREQFRWHRLQGRLDQNTTASLIAQLLLLRSDLSKLERPKD